MHLLHLSAVNLKTTKDQHLFETFLSPQWVKTNVTAQEISQHRASRYGLRTLGQCSVKAHPSPFFHGFLQVLDCGHPLGPSIYLENDLLLFIDICYSPQIHFRPSKAKKIDSENGNGVKLAIYPKIEGKWGKLPYFALLCSFNHFFSSQGKQKCICGP